MKKSFLVVLLLSFFLNPFTLTFAKTKIMYEKAQNLALQFVENSLEDESWKGNNPRFSSEGKYFYTDDEKNPSYIEFKVACDTTPDCGFILVNVDGDDVAVPISSTTGNTPSEVLLTQNGGTSEENKLYYFSLFEQYIENSETGKVSSIDVLDDIESELVNNTKLTEEEKEAKRLNHSRELKNKIVTLQESTKTYKETNEFKEAKEKIKDQILEVPEEEFAIKRLDMAYALNLVGNGGTGYILPSNVSNTFVPGLNYSGCNGRLPCYDQFNTTYNGASCKVGCVPTAYSMIYGYYDRKGAYPNLLTNTTAPTTNSLTDLTSPINVMMKDLGTNYMGTTCSGSVGGTTTNNGMNGIQYAKNKGYVNSSATAFTTNLFSNIKTEINAGRPVVVNNQNHSMVGFGYYNTTDTTKQIIRLNLGGGPLYNMTDINGTIYYGSNIDYNIGSLYYAGQNQGGVLSIVRIIIN